MIQRGFYVDREIIVLSAYIFIAASTSIISGTMTGYSSVALPVLTHNKTVIQLNDQQAPLFASLPMISQIFGSLSSLITMKHGRRAALVTGNLVAIAGYLTIAFSSSVVPLFVGRVLTGFASGLCSTPGAVYLGEISRPEWRAVLTSCTSVFVGFGIVLVYLFGFLLRDHWKAIAVICAILPAASAIATILFLPESPVWLITKGREEAARESLFRIRGLREETLKFQDEFADIVKYVEAQNSGHQDESDAKPICLGFWCKIKNLARVLGLPEVWKPLLILISYFFFQQFCGLYVVMAYAVDIIVTTGITVDPFLTSVVLGVIQVAVGIAHLICSAKIGRRTISIISGAGAALSLALTGVNLQFSTDNGNPVVAFLSIIIFVAAGSFGFFILPWALVGELYPVQYVNVLGAVTTCIGGIFTFAAIQLYPTMSRYDSIGTIYFYCAVAVLATLFMIFVLPETRGKTKMQIEEEFRDVMRRDGH